MSKNFPQEFLIRLKGIIPDHYDRVAESFDCPSPQVFRVNMLKASMTDVGARLRQQGVEFQLIPGMPEAFYVDEQARQVVIESGMIEAGEIYRQSLSSMSAVAVLDPKPDEKILDLCAAPGSKTSHIAARMKNSGEIVAVEVVRNRLYKLKSVLKLLGVKNTTCLCMDGRRFRVRDELCDRVLVDASCSSEGRFKKNNPKTYAYWSTRKIKEMVKKQRGLLFNAGRQLKSGGVLVYSTCTFSPEENEGVVDWFLGKTQGQFVLDPVMLDHLETYPAVTHWGKKIFNDQVMHCMRILPKGLAEGFFIARFRKI